MVRASLLLVLLSSRTLAEEVDYAKQVKPILARACFQCHGAQEQKSGLRLDSGKLILTGGNSGPSVTPNDSEESLLIQAITGADGVAQMPPKGDKLTDEEIEVLKNWVQQGAKFPEDEVVGGVERKTSKHWAFQPIVKPVPPPVSDSSLVRNPIDQFILKKLEEAGLNPSPEADRSTLIRRVSLDLTGLPPSIQEVEDFLKDQSSDAYERLVDRLLASPHYGERWGRIWLDLARYADSNGYTRDQPRSIWKYRDWVVEALNRDLPFDQFVVEQLAGDMLSNASEEQLIATGFHRNTLINEEGGTDPEQFRIESVVDRINTTGTVFLGLTIGCAQCHDHKYDPISQKEYYQLFAYLNNADEPKIEVLTPEQKANNELARRDELRKQVAQLEEDLKTRDKELTDDILVWEKALPQEERAKLAIPVANALNLSLEMRTPENWKALRDYYMTLSQAQEKFPEFKKIAELKGQEPQFTTTMVIRERSEPRETHIHLRGDFLRKGSKVTSAIPDVLPQIPSGGTRIDLARWLVDPKQPLTPRVTVNRIWQKYFGRGIVETENDFGIQGTVPTHPELLDWLASEFIDRKWSMKELHRLILTSATYRQASRVREDLAAADGLNRLLARQNRIRLDAETIRDNGLAASGLLSRKMGGPGVYPPQPDGVFDFTQDKKPWPTETGENRYRRAIYTYLWRSSLYPAMAVFDFPDANTTCTRRTRSNTPLQSLTLANDQTFFEFAQGLASRILREGGTTDESRIRHAFRTCLARDPNSFESTRISELLSDQRAEFNADPESAKMLIQGGVEFEGDPTEAASWVAVARVLMNLDEFMTRE